MDKIFCTKCKKTLDEGQFYTYKDKTKPNQCKKCQTMHIDNFNPETFMWLLKDMDVPYIADDWNVLRDRAYAKDPHKMTGMSVYGKYLSKMKLKQWMDYTFADSERLQAEKDNKMHGAQMSGQIKSADVIKEMYDNGEMSEAEFLTLSAEPEVHPPTDSPYPINNPGYEVMDIDIGNDLTLEDKMHLAMKWGKLYRPDEWVSLENLYHKMQNSFDIKGAAREDTLMKICKISLKMDQAIDCGNVDNFQKLSRVYDMLSKSAKFTEAQNKEDGKGFVNSVGELVALVEIEGGFIPRFDTEFSQDIVDKTIQDMNKYTYKLVTGDMGLSQQIEDYLKKMQLHQSIEDEEEELNDTISIEDIEKSVLEDADIEDYLEEIKFQRDADAAAELGEEDVT